MWLLALLLGMSLACGQEARKAGAGSHSPETSDGGGATPGPDGGATLDGGSTADGGSSLDGGSAVADGGTAADGGSTADGGSSLDGGSAVADGGTAADGGSAPATPSLADWKFFGTANGGPAMVNGVTADEGGNTWVAGGQEGLFLLTQAEQAKGAAAQFKRFTMADGLHPYGFMPDGSDVPAPHFLDVLSVSGGRAGTVFVGYRGYDPSNPGGGNDVCENNWDGAKPDPSIYKSGDADRVTLKPDGTLAVVHYDIFSGPGMVKDERAGRERLCSIYRIQYVKNTGAVWFGGNHGFAVGQADFPGVQATGCSGANYGNYRCNGLYEHAHPAYACYTSETGGSIATCTYRYYGLAPDVSGSGFWVGGMERSVHFDFGSWAGNAMAGFWAYEANQFNPAYQLDIWPDAVANGSRPSQRTSDYVFGVAAMADGSAWFASFGHGLAHVTPSGIGYLTAGLPSTYLTAAARDPQDDSLWAGGWGGVSRISGGKVTVYGVALFGSDVMSGYISDLQAVGTGSSRRILVGFRTSSTDVIGVYSGP